MTRTFISAVGIANRLRCYKIRFSGELQLQDRIASILDQENIAFDREVSLDKNNRIDFLSMGVGIEVKVDSPTNSVVRQLLRYAEHPSITELVLVTSKAKHRSVPVALLGKPCEVVFVGGVL